MSSRRVFLAALAGAVASAVDARRPNIVLILADDMGFSDIGCYGSEIHTPNLDALAQRGIRFTHFHNTARCCPSRASLLTGLYPHQAGMGHMVDSPKPFPGYAGDLNPHCVTIAEALRSAGYHTLMSGKWHVTPISKAKNNWPLQRGFEKFYGIIGGGGDYFNPATLTRDNEAIEPDKKDYYFTDEVADNAVRYIGDYAGKADPFFLYAAFTAPHWALHAPEADIELYRHRYKDGWDALRLERHRRMMELGIVDPKWPLTPRDSQAPAWKDAPNKEWQARRMAVYAAQVDRLDRGIGRILTKLKETGVEEHTLVLFLSDNGASAEELEKGFKAFYIPQKTRDGRPMRVGNDPQVMPGPDDTYQSYSLPWANASNTPFRLYKHWVHEGGISTPLIARWPAVIRQGGGITHQTGHLIDVMATCVDVAGGRYPETRQGGKVTPLEGLSLRPIFEGKPRAGYSEIGWEHEGNRAICARKWKLVSRFPDRWELYDMEADRSEMRDLASRHPDKAVDMAARYEKWASRCGVVAWERVVKG
jgi:arylsulfatase A-like enzyme